MFQPGTTTKSVSYIIRKLITTLGEQFVVQLFLWTRRNLMLETAPGSCLGCEV